MSKPNMKTDCPNAETLAAFAEGKLERRLAAPIVEHLAICAECVRAVDAVCEVLPQASPERSAARSSFRIGPWLAAAAVIAVAFLAIPQARRMVGSMFGPASPTERLADLAPRSARVVEARLSGGIPWAAYRGPERAAGSASDPARLKLDGAVGEIVEEADRRKSADLQQAAGVGLVLIEMPLEAVPRLRSATELAPQDAGAWSDLAAAQYSAALRLDRPSLYPEALASADHALRIDPRLAQARFNRALTLERLGLTAEARKEWERYLVLDPASQWSVEARQHLGRLPAARSGQLFKSEMPRLEKAAVDGDAATVASIVARHRQLARTTAEVVTLGRWGQAFRKGDDAEATHSLLVAREIGKALHRQSGESLLLGAVDAIDAADSRGRSSIAEAHDVYLRGRLAYSRHEPSKAEPDLTRAAELFAAAGDPMALVARYYAACTRFDQNDVDGARKELASLVEEVDRRPGFDALAAQVRWQLALCYMTDDDWEGALPLLASSRDAFHRLGEGSNGGFLDGLLADALLAVGRPDDGWRARIGSFASLSIDGDESRLSVSLDDAARMELRGGREEAARAMLAIEESVNREAKNDFLLVNTLVAEATLISRLGDHEAALSRAREAAATAQRIDDPALRRRASTDAELAMGAALVASDPGQASERLASAIDAYRSIELPLFLPEAHLLRARAMLRLGKKDDASREIDEGIDELDRHEVRFADSVVGRGIFDAGTELFQVAIQLALERDDPAAAFGYAERSRAHIVSSGERVAVVTAAELQRRLAGSGAVVLEPVVLPEEIVSFCITASDLAVERSPIARSAVAKLVSRGSDLDERTSARELYDLLIRPSESAIATARELIVVPDPLLESVPFAALLDARTGKHLIEQLSVAMAPSASSLRARDADDGDRRRRKLVAVSLPAAATRDAAALPQAQQELDEIARLYPDAIELDKRAATFDAFRKGAAKADIIHIAGHTERQSGAGDAALVFAGPGGDGGQRVTWKNVASTPLEPGAVVVLSACETLRRPHSPQDFGLSLGGGFLAAGAGDVIGTLEPVADNDARTLFDRLHGQLRNGSTPAEALRRTQLDALALESTQPLPWRAIALLTNRIPHDGS